MGVGDAFIAAYLHAVLKWPANPQHCLDFSLAASAMKNTVPGDQNIVSESEIENGIHYYRDKSFTDLIEWIEY